MKEVIVWLLTALCIDFNSKFSRSYNFPFLIPTCYNKLTDQLKITYFTILFRAEFRKCFLWFYLFVNMHPCMFFAFTTQFRLKLSCAAVRRFRVVFLNFFVASYVLRYFLIFLEDYLYLCWLPHQASCIMGNMLPFLKRAKISIDDNVRNLHPKYWKYLQEKSRHSWSYSQTKITHICKDCVKIYYYFIKLFPLQILARNKGWFELEEGTSK